MRPDAVLFDKDGTLIDFDATFGPAGFTLLDRLSGGDVGLLDRLADALGYDCTRRRFRSDSPFLAAPTPVYSASLATILGRPDRSVFCREIDAALAELALRSLTPIGDLKSVFRTLSESGLKLGIATNDAVRAARCQVEQLGLSPYIGFYAGYDSGYGGKPGPGMVKAFADHCRLSATRLALIGDSVHDMQAARRAGCLAIAVRSGPAAPDALVPLADHIIDHVGDLPALLAALAVPTGS
jgi:phosphoglycolate phosphatase